MGAVNLCPNPASKNNVTGYGGGASPTRVTGLSGMQRSTGARWTSGTFQQTPTGVASPGVTYTGSCYINTLGFNQSGRTLYVVFTRSVGGDDFTHTTSFSLTANVPQRISFSSLAPVNTTGIYLLIDGINAGVSNVDITAVMYDSGSTLNAYGDGDSSGWVWDGADGNSASHELDGPQAFVYNGSIEVPASVTIWNGSTELPGVIEIAP